MSNSLTEKVERGNLRSVFTLDLNWGAPNTAPIQVTLDEGFLVTATNVSNYKGVRVWEVPSLLDAAGEAKVDQAIARTSTNRLVIFRDGAKQVWRWPSRTTKGASVVSRPARHVHRAGSPDPQFEAKLDAIRLPPDTSIDVNDLLSRVRGAFDVETKNETRRASKLMAQMYAAAEKGYAPDFDPKQRDHEISVTLARVLFLLFADDTEMWTDPDGSPLPDLFQDFVKDHTARDGSDIAERFNLLFDALDTAPANRSDLPPELAEFRHVNGGIFKERITLPVLDRDFRDAILATAAVDWSTISPAIFGSMFQSVRDAQTRRELGEHYTSEENILKTLNPLFLDDLRSEVDAAMERDTDAKRVNALRILWRKLGDIRYMDPACGCGNFIIVAYRELRDLELRIMDALATLTEGVDAVALEADWTNSLKVTLDHFYGIEIDEWPARIAETAMFLIDRQCDLRMRERFGVAPERLPIQRQATIRVGNALRLNWADVCVPSEQVIVAGNPPFLGHVSRTAEQSAELRDLWERDDIGRLDYVTGWYVQALRYFGDLRARWAFVSTNSVCQGEPVETLFRAVFGAGWKIRFAHRTFPWESEATGAAAVHCVILGFDREMQAPRLFDYPHGGVVPVERAAVSINAYLVDGQSVLIRQRRDVLSPDLKPFSFGSRPNDGGAFIIAAEELPRFEADPIAAKYVRRFVGARELINGQERWCLWLAAASPEDLRMSPLVAERVERCRQHRLDSKRAATREWAQWPHLFDFNSQPSVPYLCAPSVTSELRMYFPAGHMPADVITSNLAFTAPDPDGFLFGLISSSMFLAWQKTVGGRLESRLRFSNTIVWNNFPLPEVSAHRRAAVIEAGQTVLDARARYPERSLADLYAPSSMPHDLTAAHDQLDRVVDAIFGLSEGYRSEQDRQSALFDSYVRLDAGLLGTQTRASRRRGR